MNIKFKIPTALIMLLCVFLVIPFWSLLVVFKSGVWSLPNNLPALMVVVLGYFLLPVGICVAIFLRSHLLIPLYIIECGILLTHTILLHSAQNGDMQSLRIFLIALMAMFGVLFANKEVFFPLIARTPRRWRRAPRLLVNINLNLVADDGSYIRVIMQDCSVLGMAVYGEKSLMLNEIHRHGEDAIYKFIPPKLKDWTEPLNFKIMWYRDVGPSLLIGLKADDPLAMTNFLKTIKPRNLKSMLARKLSIFWVRTALRRAMLITWAVSIAGSFAIPSCLKINNFEVYDQPQKQQVFDVHDLPSNPNDVSQWRDGFPSNSDDFVGELEE